MFFGWIRTEEYEDIFRFFLDVLSGFIVFRSIFLIDVDTIYLYFHFCFVNFYVFMITHISHND